MQKSSPRTSILEFVNTPMLKALLGVILTILTIPIFEESCTIAISNALLNSLLRQLVMVVILNANCVYLDLIKAVGVHLNSVSHISSDIKAYKPFLL